MLLFRDSAPGEETIKTHILLFTLLFVAISVTGCANDVEFEELPSRTGTLDTPTPPPETPDTLPDSQPPEAPDYTPVKDPKVGYDQFELKIGLNNKKLDMLWVIDNSGSMSTEAAHVRSNFLNFIEYIRRQTDLKLALISRAGTSGTSVSLPLGLPQNQFRQAEHSVSSTNGLQLATTAICPPVGINSVCNNVSAISGYSDSSLHNLIYDFWRSQSKKVIVFVTDDESRVPHETLIQTFSLIYPGQMLTSFGFISISRELSPCMARVGQEYKELARKTGGETFNICDTNWDNHFAKLADTSIHLAQRTFVLSQGNIELVSSVTINDVVISSSKYRVIGSELYLNEEVSYKDGDLLKVEYFFR